MMTKYLGSCHSSEIPGYLLLVLALTRSGPSRSHILEMTVVRRPMSVSQNSKSDREVDIPFTNKFPKELQQQPGLDQAKIRSQKLPFW